MFYIPCTPDVNRRCSMGRPASSSCWLIVLFHHISLVLSHFRSIYSCWLAMSTSLTQEGASQLGPVHLCVIIRPYIPILCPYYVLSTFLCPYFTCIQFTIIFVDLYWKRNASVSLLLGSQVVHGTSFIIVGRYRKNNFT